MKTSETITAILLHALRWLMARLCARVAQESWGIITAGMMRGIFKRCKEARDFSALRRFAMDVNLLADCTIAATNNDDLSDDDARDLEAMLGRLLKFWGHDDGFSTQMVGALGDRLQLLAARKKSQDVKKP